MRSEQDINQNYKICRKNIDIISQFINTERYQKDLIEDYNTWNQICSSIWVIDDTILTIESYLKNNYPEDLGVKYLYTYGILQALFVQQDSIINLAESFKIKYEINEVFRNIRNIRNISIGHPSKLKRGEDFYYGYISRFTLTKNNFSFIKTNSKEKKDFFYDISISDLIYKQSDEILKMLNNIVSVLNEYDLKYREKYKDKKMINLLPDSMSYYFEKIGSGIYHPSGARDIEFAMQMLKLVEDHYKKYNEELIERKDITTYIQFDLNQYFHAISRLKEYFEKVNNNITENDARIYLYYIRKENEHFKQIAQEIDEDYKK